MTTNTLRWGIASTGWISTKFSLDLLIDPTTRKVLDVKHQIKAVASRNLESAANFVDKVWGEAGVEKPKEGEIKLFGTYQEMFESKDIDIVYIGTPHSHHFRYAHACLSAGKHLLCEKSLTVNAAQTEILIDLARKQKVFFMEAVWTRFQPVSYKVEEIVASGILGEIRSVQAELCIDTQEETKDPSHRMVNPDLAGGALLDVGPYPWTWLALLLLPPSSSTATFAPLKVAASMTKSKSGVDAHTAAIIQFPQPNGKIIHGTLITALDSQTPKSRTCLVQGSKGFLEIHWATYRPESISYSAWDSVEDFGSMSKPATTSETISFVPRPGGIWGFAWEADECARQIRDGKTESQRMPLNQTYLMMQTFDEIRKQGQLVYPESIETVEL